MSAAAMIRTTLIGGIVFLIPLAFLGIGLEKAYLVARGVAQPIHHVLPHDTLAGTIAVGIASILLIALVCYLAGLAARLAFVARQMRRIESVLIDIVPGYAVARSTIGGVTGHDDGTTALGPVLVRFDDHTVIALEVERSEDRVVVFLPGAPATWSGSTAIVGADQVTPLDLAVHQVTGIMRVLGRGSIAALPSERD